MNHEDHKDHEVHENHENHDVSFASGFRLRIPSPLSPEAENAMTRTIGCAISVHRALGPGFLESIYRKAICIELAAQGMSYECERPVTVKYRDIDIEGQRVDLIVEGLILVELKAVVRLDRVHEGQLISYLRTTGLRGGLLINFRVPLLQQGLRRVVV